MHIVDNCEKASRPVRKPETATGTISRFFILVYYVLSCTCHVCKPIPIYTRRHAQMCVCINTRFAHTYMHTQTHTLKSLEPQYTYMHVSMQCVYISCIHCYDSCYVQLRLDEISQRVSSQELPEGISEVERAIKDHNELKVCQFYFCQFCLLTCIIHTNIIMHTVIY